MAEENNLSTKLNPDESEMELQTKAQTALKAHQDQELRSIEMEIREWENKMKQRQIPFTSLLERNQFDELDIRDDPSVSHDQRVFDWEERLHVSASSVQTSLVVLDFLADNIICRRGRSRVVIS